ncbi:precorrin methylase [Sphingobium terrigena]|uniref:Precorrin methylase n=1 Tax=Sphingobium terrigena TaxID=2304063 RepID=A0A418YVB6_9SPHN|nr:cobalamin biosynthesis protein [Sphingobium terrigena]RJG56180.1 precorrin methylase [Sphingobium terrigena]
MIAAGFGFRQGTSLASLESALALAQEGLPAVTAFAAPLDKTALLRPLADAMGVPLHVIPREALRAQVTPTSSDASLLAYGVGSVAEAAALAAAGPGATLLSQRHISADHMATCAIAQGTPA